MAGNLPVLVGLLFLLQQFSGSTLASSVSGPGTDYIILSGPLPVRYSIVNNMPGSYLGLYAKGSDTLIAKQNVQQVEEGIGQFSCDTIVVPGSYEVRLFNPTKAALAIAASPVFSAVWPTFNLTLPKTHIAQDQPHPLLKTTYISQRITCQSQSTILSFYLEVEFSEELRFVEPIVVHQERNISLWKLNRNVTSFRCELFDRAGYYRIILKELSSQMILGASNTMRVTWGDYYKMSSAQDSVFPCVDSLVVSYTRPPCIVKDDNIHLYATKRGRKAGQREMTYLYERKAPVGQKSVSFGCNDIRKYQWSNKATAYCFRYQTVALNNAVVDHDLFCLPTNSSIGLPVDGRWSHWSDWSNCSGNCEWGRQSRYRYCNNPSPSNGGRFCEGGESVEWRRCPSRCKPAVNPRPALQVTSRPASKVPVCWCGCNLPQGSGVIIPGRDCAGNADYLVHMLWLIQAAPESYVELNITNFRWSLDGQMLKVRDGATYEDKLLLDLKGNHDYNSQYILSSGSYLHIEFMSTELVPTQPDLFLATYRTITAEELSPHPQISPMPTVEGEPEWQMAAIIAGSITGGMLVVVVLGACIYRRVRIYRAIKRSQAQNTSPNHVVMQVQSGEYINFGNMTVSDRTDGGVNTTHSHVTTEVEGEQKRKHRRRHHRRGPLPGIRENETCTFEQLPLPDPYDVRPEDFIHEHDVLHMPSPSKTARRSTARAHQNVSTVNPLVLESPSTQEGPNPLVQECRSTQQGPDILNRNISPTADLPYHSVSTVDPLLLQSPAVHNRNIPYKPNKRKRKQKKRRQKTRPSAFEDPQEVDKLINSLPAGVECYAPPIDPDSEYRALINHLSTSGSHNQSELVNTSSELQRAPHTTPVEDTSQELSPLVSPNVANGQRSPCLDDGYNSLANTGSTQSNLSARERETVELPRLNRIKERPGNRSENSSELSTPLNNSSLHRHSTPSCSVDSPSHNHRQSTHSCGVELPFQASRAHDLELSHVTCPLLRPDGDSQNTYDESLPPPHEDSNQSTPRHESTAPPPAHFADSTFTVQADVSLKLLDKVNGVVMSHSNTTSDSYDYDDFRLPPGNNHSSLSDNTSWPQPPIAEKAQCDT